MAFIEFYYFIRKSSSSSAFGEASELFMWCRNMTHTASQIYKQKFHIKREHIAGDFSWIKFQLYTRYITIQLISFFFAAKILELCHCVIKTKAINRCVLIQNDRAKRYYIIDWTTHVCGVICYIRDKHSRMHIHNFGEVDLDRNFLNLSLSRSRDFMAQYQVLSVFIMQCSYYI